MEKCKSKKLIKINKHLVIRRVRTRVREKRTEIAHNRNGYFYKFHKH